MAIDLSRLREIAWGAEEALQKLTTTSNKARAVDIEPRGAHTLITLVPLEGGRRIGVYIPTNQAKDLEFGMEVIYSYSLLNRDFLVDGVRYGSVVKAE